MYTHVSNFF